MSEKNVQIEQWSKGLSVVPKTVPEATQKDRKTRQLTDYVLSSAATGEGRDSSKPLSLTSPLVTSPKILSDNLSKLRSNDVACITSRFQTPSIVGHNLTLTSPSNVVVCVAPTHIITSNVPASSGFLPSAFGTSSAVLNVKPFTTESSTSCQQQQQLTAETISFDTRKLHNLKAQKYELNKLAGTSSFCTIYLPTNGSNVTSTITSGSNSFTAKLAPTNNLHTSIDEQNPSGTIPSQITEHIIQATAGCGTHVNKSAPVHNKFMGLGVRTFDDSKLKSIQHIVETAVGEHAKQQIIQILDRISTLKPIEKLLLYLRLPSEMPETDPLRQPQNPLGTRSEINHTINWIRTHLEQDPQVSIPKQDVYNDYLLYCERLDIKPLSTADFGKVMKQVFPGIRPRRLGTRGHSRYCYAAMRKTSKLPAPHLPTITNVNLLLEAERNRAQENLGSNFSYDGEQFWPIIKQWAENILHVKMDTLNDLANHIKYHVLGIRSCSPVEGTPKTNIASQKKLQNRETKEKRLLVDLGPLKKRRKKKRKGSSSSESNCNIQQQTTGEHVRLPSPKCRQQSSQLCSPTTETEDGDKTIKMIKIKQEESPSIYARTPTRQSIIEHSTAVFPTILECQPQQQLSQSDIMPINLVSEFRESGLVIDNDKGLQLQRNSSLSAFENVNQSSQQNVTTINSTTVKNLPPKILEISSTTIPSLVPNKPLDIFPANITIKEETIADDYNTANIFCKKVLKAQQTKGFWANSPKSTLSTGNDTTTTSTVTSSIPRINVPIITTMSSAAPHIVTEVTTSSSSNTVTSSSFTMGPPSSQMTPTSSSAVSAAIAAADASSSAGLSINYNQSDDNNEANCGTASHAKVLSRNFQQLRAKKLMAAATVMATPPTTSACDPSDLTVVKDTDLPENLGLPRERVISICNMDKHELDDYFLPVEEESSEDQETELLQYFQMGDAEEKSNNKYLSSNNNNNDVVTSKTTTTVTGNINSLPTVVTTTIAATAISSTSKQDMPIPFRTNVMNDNNNSNIKTTLHLLHDAKNNATNILPATTIAINQSNRLHQNNTKCETSKTSSSPQTTTVGTASASLIQLTQKHQQQPRKQQQQQQYMNENSRTTILLKRKVNVNSLTAIPDITAARKNYSFLPISPNINTTPPKTSAFGGILSNNESFFASPHVTKTLMKQHSMDCDSSDPMIGSGRRKRTYFNVMSASAPPSPSVSKQQQQQNREQSHNVRKSALLESSWLTADSLNNDNMGFTNNDVSLTEDTNTSVSTLMLHDQNSLDLDAFSETVGATSTLTPTSISALVSKTTINMKTYHNGLGNTNVARNNILPTMNEVTQRSQSVPLSQWQRSHSPNFKRCFQIGSGSRHSAETSAKMLCGYSACPSQPHTPVPIDFGDSTTILSENSCSQHSTSIKLEEVGDVVASDTTVILDEADVSEILSSPDFVMKFSNLNQSNTTITTCSSVGSSSGYSSVCGGNGGNRNCITAVHDHNTNSISLNGNTNDITVAVSRSVPSTPLPHHYHLHQHQHNIFHSCKRYEDRFSLKCNRITDTNRLSYVNGIMENHHGTNNYNICREAALPLLTRSTCDISKSMPATPITTTPSSFRYSPTDITNDFLINGNIIEESISSTFNTCTGTTASCDDVLVPNDHLMISSSVADITENNFIDDNSKKSSINNNFNNLLNTFSAQSTITDCCNSLGDSVVMQPITSADILDNL